MSRPVPSDRSPPEPGSRVVETGADGGAGSDRTLVEAFRSRRDELAFRALYRRHSPYLYAVARRTVGGSSQEADDLLQETWVRVVAGLDNFQWRSQFRTWVVGVMYNCWRDQVRKDTRASRDVTPREPVSQPPDLAAVLDLEEAVARLPDGFREIVVLHYVYGYKHSEIARLMGISVGTSKSQASRGIKRLRKRMGTG